MPAFNRVLWRAAGHLQKFLRPITTEFGDPQLGQDYTTVVPQLTRQLKLVNQREWLAAARHVKLRLHAQLLEYQSQIRKMLDLVSDWRTVPLPPTQADLYAELVALTTEFEQCDIDLKAGTLSVVTESIVLEEVELGPFRIVLPWEERIQGQSQPYTVEALEPCCANSNSQITHPHVIRERLCEGDAQPALKHALQTGRLTDFFQIIDRVLHTYNSHSPYAALDEWDGIDCHACGTRISEDSDYCSVCEASVCYDCGTCCQFCDSSACDACLQNCSQCEERTCPECLNPCTECGQKVCPHCLAVNHLCRECAHETQSESESSTPAPATSESEAKLAVQPSGLGQIAVSA